MSFFTTGVAAVDQMGQLCITGNVKPVIWNETIVNEKGKPQRLAMDILADIAYWYRPTEVRDENSGLVVGWKKRFASDMLQRSYTELSAQFYEEKKTIIRAVIFLEELGVIKRVFRTLKYKNGMISNNVMFIDLNVQRLYELTFPRKNEIQREVSLDNDPQMQEEYEVIEECDSTGIPNTAKGETEEKPCESHDVSLQDDTAETPPYKFVERVPTKMSGGSLQICPEAPYKNVHTNTENTTENTTEITTSKSLSDQVIGESFSSCSLPSDSDEDIDSMFQYVSALMGYEQLCRDTSALSADEVGKTMDFNAILEEIRAVLVYEVFLASDDRQFNFGTKEQPDLKSCRILKNVFEKYLSFGVIKAYINQYLMNSSRVRNVTMYHLKSLYRQCMTQSSQYMSGGANFLAWEESEGGLRLGSD